MTIQVNGVEARGGGEDGDVEGVEEIGAAGRVVGDGDVAFMAKAITKGER